MRKVLAANKSSECSWAFEVTVATKFTQVHGPLFPILQGWLQSWIVTIHEDNVPNNTVVNALKPINFGRYFEWMPKLQTLAETYQEATKTKSHDL